MLRALPIAAIWVVTLAAAGLAVAFNPWWWLLALALAALAALGTWDLLQTRHTLLRTYPILAHARWLAEALRPEIRRGQAATAQRKPSLPTMPGPRGRPRRPLLADPCGS